MANTVKMKRPRFGKDAAEPSDGVVHDERGNAVWKWGRDVDPLRDDHHGELSIATTGSHRPSATAKNPGITQGYSPYNQGPAKKVSPKEKAQPSRAVELDRANHDVGQA